LQRELTIGSLDDPETALTAVGGLLIDEAGNIFVSQPQERCIKVFSATGKFLREMGRGGEGPGEFVAVGEMGWLADTLYATDARAPRVSFFRRDGAVLRSVRVNWSPPDGPFTSMTIRRALPDRTFLAQPGFYSRSVRDGEVTAVPLLRIDSLGRILSKVAEKPVGNAQLAFRKSNAEYYGRQPFVDAPLMALSPQGDHSILLYREAAQGPEAGMMRIEKVGADGDTLFVHQLPYDPIPVSAEFRDSVLGMRAEMLSHTNFFASVRQAREALEEAAFLPAFHPPAEGLVATSGGEIWIRREAVGDPETRWDVLDSDGIPLATLHLPRSVLVNESRDGLVWGIEWDEWDVPYVFRDRIVTGPTSEEAGAGGA
jgi:hypothetical protein